MPPPVPLPDPFPPLFLLLVVSLSWKKLLVVVDESLVELEVALPKIEKALPLALIGVVIGITTAASSAIPFPIP
ncbi:hypothetical protein L313_1418 [Acinetobacter haemolyticus CIP 64.3 = MTCC 9819]|nr:hypothetical protein L313_1418 [Acinetobacter haemolyticus CIP 64.3 = MTCC 9819]